MDAVLADGRRTAVGGGGGVAGTGAQVSRALQLSSLLIMESANRFHSQSALASSSSSLSSSSLASQQQQQQQREWLLEGALGSAVSAVGGAAAKAAMDGKLRAHAGLALGAMGLQHVRQGEWSLIHVSLSSIGPVVVVRYTKRRAIMERT